eukprot:TRINITY_DN33017_c0_g2_i2.p2 TRINITY_DN33017_c0_g2~~TRINITY_DN33017_c0_g2_i2.p2  ORF type:complete len:201 (+),score=24.83 TRINITY_DN33017_c0_g2_i2:54-656(+)
MAFAAMKRPAGAATAARRQHRGSCASQKRAGARSSLVCAAVSTRGTSLARPKRKATKQSAAAPGCGKASLRAPDRWHAAVWSKVQDVPEGHLSTYGDIARALGSPEHSRHVGKALGALAPHDDFEGRGQVPWWRIVNSSGRISHRGCDLTAQGSGSHQRNRLEAEGVEFGTAAATAFLGGGASIRGFAERRWEFDAAGDA